MVIHNAHIEQTLEYRLDKPNHVVLERKIDGAVHHHKLNHTVAAVAIGKPLGKGNVGGYRH